MIPRHRQELPDALSAGAYNTKGHGGAARRLSLGVASAWPPAEDEDVAIGHRNVASAAVAGRQDVRRLAVAADHFDPLHGLRRRDGCLLPQRGSQAPRSSSPPPNGRSVLDGPAPDSAAAPSPAGPSWVRTWRGRRSPTDPPTLSVHPSGHLAAIAAELDARPRKTLGWDTPAERLHKLIAT
ncbi:hypothetical protein ACIA5D_06955 [Actinoplanes sp. NPDC051513]|uniref:hypothetical protein n=1 Tax=Actinoplanes sp. NPDC051513 TaxID=3363908 RepID=UPI0037B72BEA